MSEDVQEFWLTNKRYLKQVGQTEPVMIHAAPDNPVLVRLPAKILRKTGDTEAWVDHPEDSFLKKVKPKEPVDVRPKSSFTRPELNVARPVEPPPDPDAAAASGKHKSGRAADR
jgi:hypothetical protein